MNVGIGIIVFIIIGTLLGLTIAGWVRECNNKDCPPSPPPPPPSPVCFDFEGTGVNQGFVSRMERGGWLMATLYSDYGTNALQGGGMGNKLFLNPTKCKKDFGGMLLSEYSDLQLSFFNIVMTPLFYVNMFVKLDHTTTAWNPSIDTIVICDSDKMPELGTIGYHDISLLFSDNIWVSVGGNGGLPNQFSPVGAPLTSMTNFNEAKLYSGFIADNGLMVDNDMNGFTLIVGDSVNTTGNFATIVEKGELV